MRIEGIAEPVLTKLRLIALLRSLPDHCSYIALIRDGRLILEPGFDDEKIFEVDFENQRLIDLGTRIEGAMEVMRKPEGK